MAFPIFHGTPDSLGMLPGEVFLSYLVCQSVCLFFFCSSPAREACSCNSYARLEEEQMPTYGISAKQFASSEKTHLRTGPGKNKGQSTWALDFQVHCSSATTLPPHSPYGPHPRLVWSLAAFAHVVQICVLNGHMDRAVHMPRISPAPWPCEQW